MRSMDENLRRSLSTMIEAAWKHRPMNGVACAMCGATSNPIALHVIEYAQPSSASMPQGFVCQSESYGTSRGGFPICSICAPPCRKCALPVVTRGVRRFHDSLKQRLSGTDTSLSYGNGFCQHVRLFGVWVL